VDVWALGVVLFQLLVGCSTFPTWQLTLLSTFTAWQVGWAPFLGKSQEEILSKINRAAKRIPEKMREPEAPAI
jgi:hypothetical protein